MFSEAEAANLAEGFLVANTPASLLAWLKRNPAVRRITETEGEDSLLDALLEQLACPPSETPLAIAYGVLVAIGLQRVASGVLGDLPIDPCDLSWSQPIWQRLSRGIVGTSTILVDPKIPSPKVATLADDSSAALLVNQHGMPFVKNGG